MVKSAYVIKNRFIKAIFFREVIVDKIHSNSKTFLEKVAKNWRSIVLLNVFFLFIHFSMTPLCSNLIFKHFGFFAETKFFFISTIYCRLFKFPKRNIYHIKTNIFKP